MLKFDAPKVRIQLFLSENKRVEFFNFVINTHCWSVKTVKAVAGSFNKINIVHIYVDMHIYKYCAYLRRYVDVIIKEHYR